MEIIPFQTKHQRECLQLFDSNEPTFFDESEREHFEAYLEKYKHSYWVAKEQSKIVACGGYEIENPGDARIVWLMVDQALHGKGIGRALMNHLEELIQKSGQFEKISLMTAQGVNKFYENLGYHTLKFEPKYWCDRFDLYYMEKRVKS